MTGKHKFAGASGNMKLECVTFPPAWLQGDAVVRRQNIPQSRPHLLHAWLCLQESHNPSDVPQPLPRILPGI